MLIKTLNWKLRCYKIIIMRNKDKLWQYMIRIRCYKIRKIRLILWIINCKKHYKKRKIKFRDYKVIIGIKLIHSKNKSISLIVISIILKQKSSISSRKTNSKGGDYRLPSLNNNPQFINYNIKTLNKDNKHKLNYLISSNKNKH